MEENLNVVVDMAEYNQGVIEKLDEILSYMPSGISLEERMVALSNQLTHIYTLLLFVVGISMALFVCILLYKFILRAFY